MKPKNLFNLSKRNKDVKPLNNFFSSQPIETLEKELLEIQLEFSEAVRVYKSGKTDENMKDIETLYTNKINEQMNKILRLNNL